MTSEQTKTLDALRIAINMEIDGKEYYIKASQKASSEAGAHLLRSLASAEDAHRRKFIEIYEMLRDKKSWPQQAIEAIGKVNTKTIFAEAAKKLTKKSKPLAEEAEAVMTAMGLENKTLDYYNGLASKAATAAEKEFYKSIATEEREHHIVLQDYYEFLKDPAGWFVKKEHTSLDG